MKEKTLILFDIGAVLVRLDYEGFYKAAAQHSPFDASTVEKHYLESSLDDLAIEGRITAQEFFQKLRTVLSFPASFSQEKLIRIFEKTFPEQIQEMVDLKRELSQAGYAVGLFSNIGEHAHALLSRKFPEIFNLYNSNNPAILSYKIHTMKQKPIMYESVHGYDTVILLDDKNQYLRIGIEHSGWYGIHFTKYIDKSEAQRKTHAEVEYHSQKLRNANSLETVRVALKNFGVVL